MPYCPNCGIEVDFGITICPLCSFAIPEVPHDHEAVDEKIELKNYYEELKKINKKRRKRAKGIAFIIILLIAAGAVFNNIMQDWLVHGTLTFSRYVISGMGLFIVCLICVFGFIKSWRLNMLALFISSTAFLFSLDLYEGGIEWFLQLGLPASGLCFGILFLTLTAIKKANPGRLYSGSIILVSAAVITILLELIFDLYSGVYMPGWSLKALVSTGSLALLLVIGRALVNRDFFNKLKRYLHF